MARIDIPEGLGGDGAMVWTLRPEMAGMVGKLAIEYAQRFAISHREIDDDLFDRLRSHFADDEILDLTLCLAVYLGLGRTLEVLQITEHTDLDV